MDKGQFAILRFAKYKGPEISNIEAHNERTKEKYASNPDVDTSRSKADVWQIPASVYCAMEVTMAEMAARVRPCGRIGEYLYEQMEEYNLHSDEPYELRKGENWCLGDSPVVGVLLQCAWRGNYHMQTAPMIAENMCYQPNPDGKMIRVYDFVDVRMILEDLYAKLELSRH